MILYRDRFIGDYIGRYVSPNNYQKFTNDFFDTKGKQLSKIAFSDSDQELYNSISFNKMKIFGGYTMAGIVSAVPLN